MRSPHSGLRLFGPALLVIGVAFAACSSSSTSIPVRAPATAPSAVPTLAPASASTTTSLAASGGAPAPQSVSIPQVDGLSGSVTLPAATIPAGTTLQATTSTVAPSGIAALGAARHTLDVSSGTTVLAYEGLAFSNTLTFPSSPALTFVLPSTYQPSLGTYLVAFWNGSSWTAPYGTAGTVSGQQVSFASVPASVTYTARQFYFFALYYQPTPPSPAPVPSATATATASPSPAPSATATATASASPTASATPTASASPVASASPTATPSPTPTPTVGPLSVGPASLAFTGTGSDLTANVQVSSAYYTGNFYASACVTPSPSPAPSASPSPVATVGAVASGVFTVTPQSVGTCTIDVSDDLNRHVSLPVSVATTSLTIQGKH